MKLKSTIQSLIHPAKGDLQINVEAHRDNFNPQQLEYKILDDLVKAPKGFLTKDETIANKITQLTPEKLDQYKQEHIKDRLRQHELTTWNFVRNSQHRGTINEEYLRESRRIDKITARAESEAEHAITSVDDLLRHIQNKPVLSVDYEADSQSPG